MLNDTTDTTWRLEETQSRVSCRVEQCNGLVGGLSELHDNDFCESIKTLVEFFSRSLVKKQNSIIILTCILLDCVSC